MFAHLRIAIALALLVPWVAAAQPDSGTRTPGKSGGPPGVPLPDSVVVHRDIHYAGSRDPAQTLDVLTPKHPKNDQPLPVIVNIHGGAFAMGDKGMGLEDILPLVAGGDFAGVSINYRLSGEATWPAQIYDCKAAIRWVRANAKQYHMDPERIGVIGASAGGHLVAMLGLTKGNKTLEGDVGPYKDVSSRVSCVVDEFGPTDLLTLNADGSRLDHDALDSPESRLLGGALQSNKDKAKAASPLTYVSRNAVPFLILHGSVDPLIPHAQSERLYQALKDAGVEAYFVPVTGAGHGGFRNPEVGQRIRQFFDKELLGKPEKIAEEAIPNR